MFLYSVFLGFSLVAERQKDIQIEIALWRESAEQWHWSWVE